MTAVSCPCSQESQRSPMLVFPDPRQDPPASLCSWNPALSGCSLLPHCPTLHEEVSLLQMDTQMAL